MRFGRGLTLIELLAALTLLAVFTTALGALTTTLSRATHRIDRVAHSDRLAQRALALLRRDLDEAWADSTTVDATHSSITLVTTHTLPAEAPGWATVMWRLEPDGDFTTSLVRERTPLHAEQTGTPVPQVVLRGVEGFTIAPEGASDAGGLVMTLVCADGSTASITIPGLGVSQ